MRQNRKTMREPVALGRVIGRVLDSYRCKSNPELAEMWDTWNRAVGSAIAANTRPVVFKNSRLIVHVTNSAWIYELQFLKRDILKKINISFKKDRVKDIKFKIGLV